MNELELLQSQVKLLQKENEVLNKTVGIEFERIAKAFSQMGNLMDLVYLEVSVLIEMIADKKLFTQEEFTKKLEDTAKKVEEEMAKASAAAKAEQEKPKDPSPIIEKI
jgi:hypothetical protein